jgi:hypothetical protein
MKPVDNVTITVAYFDDTTVRLAERADSSEL